MNNKRQLKKSDFALAPTGIHTCGAKEEASIPVQLPWLTAANDGLKEVKPGDTATWTVTLKNNEEDAKKDALAVMLKNFDEVIAKQVVMEHEGRVIDQPRQIIDILSGAAEELTVSYTVPEGEAGVIADIPTCL